MEKGSAKPCRGRAVQREGSAVQCKSAVQSEGSAEAAGRDDPGARFSYNTIPLEGPGDKYRANS